MSALGMALIAFACIFGATLLTMYFRDSLNERHLNADSKDAIRLSMGVIATMAALVLGLLIASAKSSFDAKSGQVKQVTAQIVLIDQLLAQYGPEAREARTLLRLGVGALADKIWSEGDETAVKAGSFTSNAGTEVFVNTLLGLKPQTETQQFIKQRAVNAITELAQTRLLLYAQAGNAIPLPFLTLLVFWLAIIFASFSLFVKPNRVVVLAFLVSAFSASGAIYLILELDRPFTGFMAISDTALRHALAPL